MRRISVVLLVVAGVMFFRSSATAQNPVVKIGTQSWCVKNLDVSIFRNGDPITEVKTLEDWLIAGYQGIPAWCYYDNDPANGATYGKLYNLHAVRDPRGLAPEGFHIASMSEWLRIIDFTDGQNNNFDPTRSVSLNNANCLKSKTGWLDESLAGTDDFGFAALPSGARGMLDDFNRLKTYASWWTSTGEVCANIENNTVSVANAFPTVGLAVRCIQGEALVNEVAPLKNTRYNIHSVYVDRKGAIWVSSMDEFIKINDGKIISRFKRPEVPATITKVYVDINYNIWVMDLLGGLFKYDSKAWTEVKLKGKSEVNDMACDSKGTMWFAMNDGLYTLDGKKWTKIDYKQSVIFDHMVIDSHDNIWLTNFSFRGLYKYDGQSIQYFPFERESIFDYSYHVMCLYADKNGNVWIGTGVPDNLNKEAKYKGIIRYDGKSWKPYLENEHIYSINQTTGGDYIVSTDKGIYRNFRIFSKEYVSDFIVPGLNNDIWVIDRHDNRMVRLEEY